MSSILLFLARALVNAAVTDAFRRALPLIYKRLDYEVPVLLTNNAPPSRVEGVIASAISDALGKRATPTQIETVITLYDPVKAALRNPRR